MPSQRLVIITLAEWRACQWPKKEDAWQGRTVARSSCWGRAIMPLNGPQALEDEQTTANPSLMPPERPTRPRAARQGDRSNPKALSQLTAAMTKPLRSASHMRQSPGSRGYDRHSSSRSDSRPPRPQPDEQSLRPPETPPSSLLATRTNRSTIVRISAAASPTSPRPSTRATPPTGSRNEANAAGGSISIDRSARPISRSSTQ
jgi:hypothetical protein